MEKDGQLKLGILSHIQHKPLTGDTEQTMNADLGKV